jgi:hypothetical protein
MDRISILGFPVQFSIHPFNVLDPQGRNFFLPAVLLYLQTRVPACASTSKSASRIFITAWLINSASLH